MKNAVSGGMNEQEVRAMLKKRGVKAFMRLAGSLPQKDKNEANFDDLPTFSVVQFYKQARYGKSDYVIFSVWLECDEPLCYSCADNLDLFIQPSLGKLEGRQVNFHHWWQGESCSVCGCVCDDRPIPF